MDDYLADMFRLARDGELQGIWFWAAVYVALVCTASLRFQLRTRRWPTTTGQLARLGIRRFGASEMTLSEQDHVGDALYTYRVAGKDYEGRRISPWIVVASHNARALLRLQNRGVVRAASGEVRVHYDPRRPQKSFLVVAGWPGLLLTAAVIVLPAVGYYFRFHH
ncbi:MAG: DUF3592 domain-containing protein [Pseudomonadales bacterium]|jgi:hypothetical protein|nr:DUF3592 domain-containing protein [Pseudomonadales bacterium]